MAKKQYFSFVEVKKLARLAKLTVLPAEIKKLQSDLEKTVDYVNNINELNGQIKEIKKREKPVFSHMNRFFLDGEINHRHLTRNQVFNKKYKDKNLRYFAVKKIQ